MKINFPIITGKVIASKNCRWFDTRNDFHACKHYCCGKIDGQCPFNSLGYQKYSFSSYGKKLNEEGKLKFIELDEKTAKIFGKFYGHK